MTNKLAFLTEAKEINKKKILTGLCKANSRLYGESKSTYKVSLLLASGGSIAVNPLEIIEGSEVLCLEENEGSLIYIDLPQVTGIRLPANEDLIRLLKDRAPAPNADSIPSPLNLKRHLKEIAESLNPKTKLELTEYQSLSDESQGNFLYNVLILTKHLPKVFSGINSDNLGKEALSKISKIEFAPSEGTATKGSQSENGITIHVTTEVYVKDDHELLTDLLNSNL